MGKLCILTGAECPEFKKMCLNCEFSSTDDGETYVCNNEENKAAAIEKIKGFFNVTLSFPHIKLPHFRITAGVIPWGIGGKGTPPSIGIDWYDKGGIFDAPTIIGVGERRPEFVGALDDLREIVREESGPTINYGGVTINVNGTGTSAEEFARKLKIILDRGV